MQGQPGWHFWFVAFSLTLALEAPWIFTGLRSFEPSRSRRALALLFANLATHPLVWYLFPALPLGHSISLMGSELWAFAGEWLFYATYIRRLNHRRAALLSLAANATSWLVGSLIIRYFGSALFRW